MRWGASVSDPMSPTLLEQGCRPVPDEYTIRKVARRGGAEPIEELNAELLGTAGGGGLVNLARGECPTSSCQPIRIC